MKNKKLIKNLSLIFNSLNVIFVIYAVVSFFFVKDESLLISMKWECFRYFTIDSNILMAITSIIMIVSIIKNYKNNNNFVQKCAKTCKFVGTVAVTVTFLTVMFFLGPTMGYKEMIIGGNLYLHLICPLLAIVSYVLFETGNDFNNKYLHLGILPTIIYGILYVILVIFTKTWPDFYGFNIKGMWYVSFVVLLVATYGISCALYKLNVIVGEKVSKK